MRISPLVTGAIAKRSFDKLVTIDPVACPAVIIGLCLGERIG